MCLEVGLEVQSGALSILVGVGVGGHFPKRKLVTRMEGKISPHGNIFSRAVVAQAFNAITGEEEVEESL